MEKKVAVVTGASRGIGAAIARELAAAGMYVVINYCGSEEKAQELKTEIEQNGGEASIYKCDVSDNVACKEFIGNVIAEYGHLDVLVNNAGAMTKAPFLDMAFDEWRKIFPVDVDGAFLCSQIAARQMVKQGQGGRIINITSVHEHTPLPDASAYTAAKHALGGLTKAMALELVRHKILVNAVAPGAIATPMNGMDDSDVKPDAEPSIPLRRFGTTHEIASLVVWLCSEGANYTTGQSLIVDGGFMLANPQFNPE